MKASARAWRIQRDESQANGTVTQIVFSGGTSCFEQAGGNTTVGYVRGSDWGGGVGGILYTLRDGVASYTHNNGRGDIIAKTSGNGSLTYQAAYEAFGTRTQEVGATQDRQKGNSKDEDPTGLLNEGFHYRDLETGTFLTRDPLGFVDGPNLYTYVLQNPWTMFDPEGLKVEVVSRNVKTTLGFGAHTWVEVTESEGKRTTGSGTREKTDKGDKLGVKINDSPDLKPSTKNPVESRYEVPPPKGMSQDEWDRAVVKSVKRESEKSEQRDYKLGGGDGGKKSGNCHVVTSDIIQGAGGKIPANVNPPRLNPGLRTDKNSDPQSQSPKPTTNPSKSAKEDQKQSKTETQSSQQKSAAPKNESSSPATSARRPPPPKEKND